jgi:NAD(P)-dependent dehydrogenase (short-subunit alcohol dehydrogenase family)
MVTGAAQGIGAAYASALAAEGAAVCVSDIVMPDQTCASIRDKGGRALGLIADVCSAASAATMVARTVEAFGRADILVNNAALFGQLPLKPFDQIETAEWDAVMNVNVRGVFECIKAAAPQMRKQGYGKIVNIASGTVFKGTPMLLHYVTSKGAVVALTRAVARELGADGICVNCIAPGLTLSDNVKSNPAWAQSLIAGNTASRAIVREMHPDDLLGTLLFLCSSDSDFMTGQTIVADGGSVMH